MLSGRECRARIGDDARRSNTHVAGEFAEAEDFDAQSELLEQVAEVAPDPQATFTEGEPQRPRGNASQETWAAYAVSLGALGEDEASGMTRDQIVAAVSDGDAG